MKKGRIEAFSDGVIAIIITIMVLEIKVPHDKNELKDLLPLWPVFFSYVLSFLYVGIYWNNHHHIFAVVHKVNGAVLWANMHLLFWLSMIPFTTAWMGENNFAEATMAVYAFVMLMNAIAYTILTYVLVKHHGENSLLKRAIGGDLKGKVSLACYIMAIPIAYLHIWISAFLLSFVAFLWLIPDKRIERALHEEEGLI